MDSNLKVLKNHRCVSTGCTDVNVIVPGDNGRRKKRKKISKEIIFSSDTINMPPSEWSALIPVLGSLQKPTDHGLGVKQGMPVQ